MKRKLTILCISLFFVGVYVQAQSGDTTKVNIISANFLYLKPETNLQILSGNVKLKQGTTLFYCDSCVVNSAANTFEAFGKVHINDSDTTNVWSDHLNYIGNNKMAYLDGNVKMSDGHATLTTNQLEYDVASKIGTYKNGGRVVNKKSVLTSQEGIYYTDIRDIYFKKNVELKDPSYSLKTDSLLYNTETQVARFIAETYIVDSSKREIKTREGYYDVAHSRAEFTSRTTIRDKAMTAVGDRIASDDSTQIIQIEGQGVLIDTAQGVNILANRIFANKKTGAYLATQKPLMIIKQDKDSLYIAADTLFSARLTDLYKSQDSLLSDSLLTQLNLKETDSTNRYFEAYRNVRIFSDSMQAVSDSMFYTFKDSIFNLYYDPVVWSRKSQITGDTIYLYTKNKKADRVKAFENSFMVSEVQAGVYNQVKSTRMDGFFKEGVIDSVRARGAAESVYFIQDEDSAFTSVNQTSSDVLDVYFTKGEINKVVLRSTVKGTLWPISQKQPSAMRLPNFEWLENRRPKTKYELFE
jgi:lipopolysaccharide export system protein LptA